MKSKNLRKMKDEGIRIPEFITFSFEEMINDMEGAKELLKRAASCPQEEFYKISREWQSFVRENFFANFSLSLPGEEFAVRSSANLEDGASLSFAGIFESFLRVRKEEVGQRVLQCLQSLYGERALEYIRLKGIDPLLLKMDVIVQEMVYAQKSGILFTANPQGILNETVIVAGEGSGDLVVSDKIETSMYLYHQNEKSYYLSKGEDILSKEVLQELVDCGERIKDILEMEYADIEFTIQENKVYILQARRITGLKEEGHIVLDNSNISESYPGLTLPLTESFAGMLYAGVFEGAARRILPSRKVLLSLKPVFEQMVDSLGGRMYYRIDNWYKILRFLPMSSRIIPIWQDMLGVKNRSYSEEEIAAGFWIRFGGGIRFLWELLFIGVSMKRLNREFEKVFAEFYRRDLKLLSPGELKACFLELKERLIVNWDLTLINDMYAFIFTGLLEKRLKKENQKEAQKRLGEFIGSILNIESMKPVIEFRKLARLWKNEGESAAYREAKERYIRAFGDRTIEELKLETKTFRSNPEFLQKALEEYPEEEEKEDFGAGKAHPESVGKIAGFFAKRAKKGIEYREQSRMNRSRIFGMVRAIMLRMAEHFQNQGILKERDDIFYLYLEEVHSLADKGKTGEKEGKTGAKNLQSEKEEKEAIRKRIEERKARYREYEKSLFYNRLVLSGEEAKLHYIRRAALLKEGEKNELQGIACSAGKVSGEVLAVNSPEDAKAAPGKIIVAKMTDPGWVFLLSTAKGIITEKGSLLSHTAIISRELKIPAIVGVEKVCGILKSGDLIMMDGNTGKIKRQEEKGCDA